MSLNEKRQRQQKPLKTDPPVSAPDPLEPWPELIPFDTEEKPPAFPLEIYTDNVRRMIDETTADTRASVDYAAGAILSTAASAIGGTCRAVGKGRWSEHPALWVVLVGLPSEKKTPSASIIQSPLMTANSRRIKIAAKRDREHAAVGNDDEPRIYDNDEGLIVVQSCTSEGLAKAFERQRRGLLYTRPELTGWIEGLNQYKSGKGDDRQFFIEAYDGKSHTKTLVGGTVHCPNVCLNMFGGIQPAVVEKFTGVSDGLDARLLPIYPACRVATREDWATVSHDTMSRWSSIVHRLLGQSMEVDCDTETGEVTHKPTLYHMDAAAKERWVSYTEWASGLQNSEDISPKVKEWLGKHEGFGLRVAITLRMLAEADSETRPRETITALDVERSTKLMTYFYGMVRRLYGCKGKTNDELLPLVRWLREWSKQSPTFSERDLFRGNNSRFDEMKDVSIACWKLRDYGYLREVPKTPSDRANKCTTWEISPRIEHSKEGAS